MVKALIKKGDIDPDEGDIVIETISAVIEE